MFHTPVHKLSRLDLIEMRAEQRAREREIEAERARERIEAYYRRQDRLMAHLGVEAPEWGDRY